jgi:hypothetical protein
MKLLLQNCSFREALFQKEECRRKSKNKVVVMFMKTEHGFLDKGLSNTFTKHTFIADSGATCHMRSSLEGMFDMKP